MIKIYYPHNHKRVMIWYSIPLPAQTWTEKCPQTGISIMQNQLPVIKEKLKNYLIDKSKQTIKVKCCGRKTFFLGGGGGGFLLIFNKLHIFIVSIYFKLRYFIKKNIIFFQFNQNYKNKKFKWFQRRKIRTSKRMPLEEEDWEREAIDRWKSLLIWG